MIQPKTTPRLTQTEKKQKKILAVTQDLIKTRLIPDISIEEIAAKSEVSKVTIFKYFQSKSHLMNLVLMMALEDLINEADQVIRSDLGYLDTFRQMVQLELARTKKFTPAFSQNLMQQYTSDPDFFDGDIRNLQEDMYLRLIHKGRSEGFIDPRFTDAYIKGYLTIFTEGSKALDMDFLVEHAEEFTLSFINAFKTGESS